MAAPVSVLSSLFAAAFLEWERSQEGRYEWCDGEVFAMSGGTLRDSAFGAAVVGAGPYLFNVYIVRPPA